MKLKKIKNHKKAEWEEIPDEELWEDGEIGELQVKNKIIYHTLKEGDWILIRKAEYAK